MTKFKVGDFVEIISDEYLNCVYERPGIIIHVDEQWPENHILHLHTVFVNDREVMAHPTELKLIE